MNNEANPTIAQSSRWARKELINMSDLTAARQDGEFSAKDYAYLLRNDLGRYNKNSPWVAHAVIRTNADGKKIAEQYSFPAPDDDQSLPMVRTLVDIEEIERNGLVRHQAKGLDGKQWTAKRYEHAIIKSNSASNTIPIDIAYFSEDDDDSDTEQDAAIKWGSSTRTPRLHSTSSTISKRKGGHILTIEPNSVLHRDKNKDRGISQNQIMALPGQSAASKGHSARDAYELFFKDYESKLSAPMIQLLKRAFQADIKVSPENKYRPEWLHAYGFSLTPLSQNPQRKENFGAASAWANTEMTVLEQMAKWFSLNQNSSHQVRIQTLYDMLDQSELIDTIYFNTSIQFQSRIINFIQEIDAFKEIPIFRKGTDVTQATGICHALLHEAVPNSSMEIKPESLSQAKVYKQVPEANSFESYTNTSSEPAKKIMIFDLETTSLNHKTGKIIEFGALLASFTETQGVLEYINGYNGLQDPCEPLSDEVKEVTHISDEQLQGQSIDWSIVQNMIEQADYILCHNAAFDRRYLEAQAPINIKELVKNKHFGCTLKDINWWQRGNKSQTLTNLNARLGFKFTGHRAINDCWATLNLLRSVENAIPELMHNIHQTKTLICAVGAAFDKKDALKRKGFQWSNGTEQNIPKCWYAYVNNDELIEAKAWLDDVIYNGKIKSPLLPQRENITAKERYSERSELEAPNNASATATSSNQASSSSNISSSNATLKKTKKPTRKRQAAPNFFKPAPKKQEVKEEPLKHNAASSSSSFSA